VSFAKSTWLDVNREVAGRVFAVVPCTLIQNKIREPLAHAAHRSGMEVHVPSGDDTEEA
jgi:hypothetical protein